MPRPAPAVEPTLTIADVDAAFTRLAAAQGTGSQRERARCSTACSARPRPTSRTTSCGVVIGELRQGANEGVLTDAVAKAAGDRWPTCAGRRCCSAISAPRPALALAGAELDVGLTPLVGVQPMLASTADVGHRGAGADRAGERRVEARRGARAGPPRGDDVRVYTRTLHEVGGRVAGDRRVGAGPADRRHRARRRVARPRPRRQPAEVPGHDERHARRCARSSSTCSTPTAQSLIDRPLPERKAVLAELVPAGLRLPTLDTADADEAEAFADDGARRRPRGRDGQGARLAVPGRPARRDVAQGQAGAHARPRGARRRVGPRPSARLAEQPAPRRPRRRRRS